MCVGGGGGGEERQKGWEKVIEVMLLHEIICPCIPISHRDFKLEIKTFLPNRRGKKDINC